MIQTMNSDDMNLVAQPERSDDTSTLVVCATDWDRNTLEALPALRSNNASLPVSRLPAELLCAAFLWLPGLVDRIAVSAVCHYWRVVVLGCSELWSTLDARTMKISTRGLVKLIGRTQSTTLDIRLAFRDPAASYAKLVAKMSTNMYRMGALAIHDRLWMIERLFTGTSTLARLELLDLAAYFDIGNYPKAKSKGNTPLQALCRSPLDFHALKLWFPRLHTLKLANYAPGPDPLYDLDHESPAHQGPYPDFRVVTLVGAVAWMGKHALRTLRASAHAYLQLGSQYWDILSQLPTVERIDGLALLFLPGRGAILAARSGARTRSAAFGQTMSYQESAGLWRDFSESDLTRNLVSLTLHAGYYRGVVSMPLLRELTVIVSEHEDYARDKLITRLFSPQMDFVWQCPSLETLTIAAVPQVPTRTTVVCVQDGQAVVFLRDGLGFSADYMLDKLVLVNVALVDVDERDIYVHELMLEDQGLFDSSSLREIIYLPVKRRRDSLVKVTSALRYVEDIEMVEDWDYTGVPGWWKDEFVRND